MSIKIKKINTKLEFDLLMPVWDQLLCECSHLSFFLSWPWLNGWWQHYANNNDILNIIIIEENSALIAIIPFYLQENNILRFIGTGEKEIEEVASEYLDIICTLDNQKKISKIAANELIQNSQANIKITFDHYLPNSTVQFLIDQLRAVYWQQTTISGIRHWAELPKQISEYEQQCDQSLIKKLLRHKRKLMNTLQGDFINFNQAKNVDEGLNILTELHMKRWTDQGKSGAFISDKFKKFHQQFCYTAAEKNWLQLWILKSESTAIAAIYAIEFNNNCYFYQSGINSQFKPNLSPGFLSHFLLIEKCIARNITSYDFMKSKSEMSYKTSLSNFSDNMYQTTLLKKSYLNSIEMLKFVVIKQLKLVKKLLKPKGHK